MRGQNLVTAVVDTNIFVSGLIAGRGANHQLILRLYQRSFILLISPDLRAEYEDILGREALLNKYPRLAAEQPELLRVIGIDGVLVQPAPQLPVAVRDPKDDMVLAAALGGSAQFLVSNDQDLLSLAGARQLGSLRIVNVVDFLAELATQEEGASEL